MALALNTTLRELFIAARDNPPIRDTLGAGMLKDLTFDDMESSVRALRPPATTRRRSTRRNS